MKTVVAVILSILIPLIGCGALITWCYYAYNGYEITLWIMVGLAVSGFVLLGAMNLFPIIKSKLNGKHQEDVQ